MIFIDLQMIDYFICSRVVVSLGVSGLNTLSGCSLSKTSDLAFSYPALFLFSCPSVSMRLWYQDPL